MKDSVWIRYDISLTGERMPVYKTYETGHSFTCGWGQARNKAEALPDASIVSKSSTHYVIHWPSKNWAIKSTVFQRVEFTR